MIIRALLIEDEPEGLENLKNLLRMYCPEVEVVATGGSNAALIELVNGQPDPRFDVAFLDISLPDGLVFQGLQKLEDVPFDIIFVTAYNKYAHRAFEFAALDYVTKPIEREELIRAVGRIRIKETATRERLDILQQGAGGATNSFEKIGISALDGIHFVKIPDIVRLEAADNYTHFILRNADRITASKTIKTYEDLLIQMNFSRVHKKHLVNLNCIKTYIKGEGGYLVLENGETIEVSRRKKPALMDAIRRHQDL
jgi:two-component system LytT family response regulator